MSLNKTSAVLANSIRVAVVQTTTDADVAWSTGFAMNTVEAEGAWHEITRAFQLLSDDKQSPDIVLCPELALPTGYLGDMRDLATSLGCVVVTGVDYQVNPKRKTIANRGVVIVPKGWPERKHTSMADQFPFRENLRGANRE